MKQTLEATTHPDGQLIWAVYCVAFFGFFRLGELLLESNAAFSQATHLAWGDVAVDNPANPQMLHFHLKRSKTDQLGVGVDVILGRTQSDLCPVTAVLGYLVLRGDSPCPFFIDRSGRPLLKQTFVGEVRKLLAALGIPQDQYAGHSFRIGAATMAALAGVEDSMVPVLLEWAGGACYSTEG